MAAVPSGLAEFVVEYHQEHPFWPQVRSALGVLLGYCLLYAVLFVPVLRVGQWLAPGDGFGVSLTAFRSPRGAWDPALFAGFPALADPNRMLWYPPAILTSFLPGDFNLFVLSAYVLASTFAHGYVRALTRCSFAAATAGLVYGMSGFMVAHLGHPSLIHAWAWLPAVLLCLEKLRQSANALWTAAAALAIAQTALAGQSDVLFGAVWVALYAVVGGSGAPTGRWRYYGAVAGSALLGLSLAAILLLPRHQLAKGSAAASIDYESFTAFNLPLKQLPQLIYPYAFGNARDVPYFGAGGLTETTGYVGLLPLLLAGLGGVLSSDRRLARYWMAVAACGLLLSLGRDAGTAAIAYRLPVFNQLPCPGRHLGEVALAMSVLSGLGVAWLEQAPRSRRLFACGVASGLLLALIGLAWLSWAFSGLPPAAMSHGRLPWNAVPIRAGLALVMGGLTCLWLYAARPHWIAASLLLLAVALDLGHSARKAEWSASGVDAGALEIPPALTKYRDELNASGERLTVFPTLPPNALDPARANLPEVWRLPTTSGRHPLVSQRVVQLGLPADRLIGSELLNDDNRVLDVLASRYVVAPKKLLDPADRDFQPLIARHLQSPRFVRAEEFDQTISFRNTRARPRAWLVDDLRQPSEADIVSALKTSQLPDGSRFDPARTALVEKPCAFTHKANESTSDATATVGEVSPGFARIETESSSASFCVLSDMYYPGWRATIDGNSAEIHRTDFVLMGVDVPPGKHTLIFRYVPTRFYLGAAVSGGALAIVLGLLLRAWRAATRSA